MKGTIYRISKFLTVGGLNTFVDLLITNLLFSLLSSQNELTVAFCGFIGALGGTLNSFFLNRYWTFNYQYNFKFKEMFFFFIAAGISILVNTSIFLFCLKYLPRYLYLEEVVLLNLSKLIAIICASFLSYCIVRFWVFPSESLKKFRHSFVFPAFDQKKVFIHLTLLLAISTILRLTYLSINSYIFGDGVTYSNLAQLIADGRLSDVDTFWMSSFIWWESLFHFFLNPIPATVASVLIPGILLVIPVYFIASKTYGNTIGLLSGLFIAFHPRLIEYSTNGYSESFSILLLTSSVAVILFSPNKSSPYQVYIAGAILGLYVCVRNEGILLVPVFGILPIYTSYWKWKNTIQFVAAACVSITLYIAACQIAFQSPCFLQKFTVLTKKYHEQLDPIKAAQETYGTEKVQQKKSAFLLTLIKRMPRNIQYIAERLPGVLLSPIFIFALLFFVIGPRFSNSFIYTSNLFLLTIFLYPLTIYSLIQVEPRLLFPILTPISIWGAAGVVVFCYYAKLKYNSNFWFYLTISLILLLMSLITLWRGFEIRKNQQIHTGLAQWIKNYIPSQQKLLGNGYGYISNTSFLTPNPSAKFPWFENEKSLIDFVKDSNEKWYVIYEEYILKYNPQLKHILNEGIPGAEKKFELQSEDGTRVQIYKKLDK